MGGEGKSDWEMTPGRAPPLVLKKGTGGGSPGFGATAATRTGSSGGREGGVGGGRREKGTGSEETGEGEWGEGGRRRRGEGEEKRKGGDVSGTGSYEQ